ncbi:MAG: oxidoreductase [Deltaproteobacteria bacterium]|nr:oxidoreductase [Deltaproteobacteria bacterium]
MASEQKWTAEQMKSQQGKRVVVTGANSGIGLEAARQLAHAGAEVILACRSPERGEAAVEQIRAEGPTGTATRRTLDLADLRSVEAFAASFEGEAKIDLLILNAGIMMPPERSETRQGFEMQFGVNHLGHFALTGQLLGHLAAEARVTVISSGAHRWGAIDFEDPNWRRRRYKRAPSYGQSKLANLLFARELQRRLAQAGSRIQVTAAHPGWTATNLQDESGIFRALNPLLAMKVEQGTLPTLRAATDEALSGGEYVGPDGWMEMRGYPVLVDRSDAAKDDAAAARLWELSEELTGIRYESLAS